ncbi:uncharacterized protein C17orf107 homolog isoform X2 [Monodelphis domestica]|uniref:uncharacterized protein C17orf107 homolog isoform X2 n=1 Tax=Monodelphis domestica TaxID=13616 RepID=UPI00044332C4|nr:uncharacterized protein C17orf107 homolog isoform X2 [Monodelphis domestica]
MKVSSGSLDTLLWVYHYHSSTEVALQPPLICSLELALSAAHEYLEIGLEKLKPRGPGDQNREAGELPEREGVKTEAHSFPTTPEASLGLVLREAVGSALSFGTTLMQISALWLKLEIRRLCGCSGPGHNQSLGNPGRALSRLALAAGRGVKEVGTLAKTSAQLLLNGAWFCLPGRNVDAYSPRKKASPLWPWPFGWGGEKREPSGGLEMK